MPSSPCRTQAPSGNEEKGNLCVDDSAADDDEGDGVLITSGLNFAFSAHLMAKATNLFLSI